MSLNPTHFGLPLTANEVQTLSFIMTSLIFAVDSPNAKFMLDARIPALKGRKGGRKVNPPVNSSLIVLQLNRYYDTVVVRFSVMW